MIEPDIIVLPCSTLDHPSPRRRDPDPDDLDRLAASLHALAFWYREPAADQGGDHVAIEPVSDHEQLLGGAMGVACEQL